MSKISLVELKELFDSKAKFDLFDVRARVRFVEKHIKGALSLPTDKIDLVVKGLDKSRLIVVYCGGFSCPLSGFAAEKLASLGFKVKAFEGGLSEWVMAGLPVEG